MLLLETLAREVVRRWENGDLAEAVRMLDVYLKEKDADTGNYPLYRCPYCNSSNVWMDAYASMNDHDDVQTFDDKVCQDCGEHFDEAVEDNGED